MKTDKHGNIICPDCEGKGGSCGYPDAVNPNGKITWDKCDTCKGNGIVEYICPFCKEPNEKDEPGNCDMCSHCGPSGV